MANVANVRSDMASTIAQFDRLNQVFERQSRTADALAAKMRALGGAYDSASAKSNIESRRQGADYRLQNQIRDMKTLASQYDAASTRVKNFQETVKRLTATQMAQRAQMQQDIRSGVYRADRSVSRVDAGALRASFDARNQYKYDKLGATASEQIRAVDAAKRFNIAKAETATLNKMMAADATKEYQTLRATVALEQQMSTIRAHEADSISKSNRQLSMQLDSMRTMVQLRAKLRENEVNFRLSEFARRMPKGSDEYTAYEQKLRRRQRFESSQDAVRLATMTEQQQLKAASREQEAQISASNRVRDAKIKNINVVANAQATADNKINQLALSQTQKVEQLNLAAETRKNSIRELLALRVHNLRLTLDAQATRQLQAEEERRAKMADRVNAESAKNRLRQQQAAERQLLSQQLAQAKQVAVANYNAYRDAIDRRKTLNSAAYARELNALKQQIAAVDTLRRLKSEEEKIQQRITQATRQTAQAQRTGSSRVLQKHLRAQQQQLDAVRGLGSAHKMAAQQAVDAWKYAVANQIMATVRRLATYMYTSIMQSIQRAREAQVWVARIQTISQGDGVSNTEWYDRAMQVSNRYGAELSDVLSAAYTTVSDQVAKGVDAINLLNSAIKLSLAGVSTLDEALMTQNATLNSYQLNVAEAENVNAVWFKTLELGRLKLEETSNEIGRSAPIAHQLGLSLEETNAQLAALTIQGMKFQVANTLVRNIMLKLIKPTKEMDELFKSWGVTSGEAAVQAYGFSGVLERIFEAAKGGGSRALGDLAGEIRSITGYTALLSDGGQRYRDYLDQMMDAQVQYSNATDIMLNTTAQAWKEQLNQVQNYFTRDFGQGVLNMFGLFEAHGVNFADVLENKVVPAVKMLLSLFAARTLVKGMSALSMAGGSMFAQSQASIDATAINANASRQIALLTTQTAERQKHILQMTQMVASGQQLNQSEMSRLATLQAEQAAQGQLLGQEIQRRAQAQAVLANERAILVARRAQILSTIKTAGVTVGVSLVVHSIAKQIKAQADATEFLRQLEIERLTQSERQATEMEKQIKLLQVLRIDATKFRQSWNTLTLGLVGQSRHAADRLENDFKKSFSSVEKYLDTVFSSLSKHLDKLKSRLVESFKYTRGLNQDSSYFTFERMFDAIGNMDEGWNKARASAIGYYQAIATGQRTASAEILVAGRKLEFLAGWLNQIKSEQAGYYQQAMAGDEYALEQARKLNEQILARADTLHQVGMRDDEIRQYEVTEKARINAFEAQLRQRIVSERQQLQAVHDSEMQQYKQLKDERDATLVALRDSSGLSEQERRQRRQEVSTNYAQRLEALIRQSQQITDYLLRQEQIYSFDSSMQTQTSELIDALSESSDAMTRPLWLIEKQFREYAKEQQRAQDYESLRMVFDDVKQSMSEFQQAVFVSSKQVIQQSTKNIEDVFKSADARKLGQGLFDYSTGNARTAVFAGLGLDVDEVQYAALQRLMPGSVATLKEGQLGLSELRATDYDLLGRNTFELTSKALGDFATKYNWTKLGGQVVDAMLGPYTMGRRAAGYRAKTDTLMFDPRVLAQTLQNQMLDLTGRAGQMTGAEMNKAMADLAAGVEFLSKERVRVSSLIEEGQGIPSSAFGGLIDYAEYLKDVSPALQQAFTDFTNITRAKLREEFAKNIIPSSNLDPAIRESENAKLLAQMEQLGFDEKEMMQFKQMAEAVDTGLKLQSKIADSTSLSAKLLSQQLTLLTTADPAERSRLQKEFTDANRIAEAQRGHAELIAQDYENRPEEWKMFDEAQARLNENIASMSKLLTRFRSPSEYVTTGPGGARQYDSAMASQDYETLSNYAEAIRNEQASLLRMKQKRGMLGYEPFRYEAPAGVEPISAYMRLSAPDATGISTIQAIENLDSAVRQGWQYHTQFLKPEFDTRATAPLVTPAPTVQNPETGTQGVTPDGGAITINTNLTLDGSVLARHIETINRRNTRNGFLGRTLQN